jgi:hypothetical protein
MGLLLHQIRIVDLTHSVLNKDGNNKKRGIYNFKKKEYISYETKGRICPWKFMWVRYNSDDDYADVRDYQTSYGAEAVTTKDPYWPEPVRPNNEGIYRHRDTILMKIPLINWLRHLDEAEADSNRAVGVKQKEYEDKIQSEGGVVEEVPDSVMDELTDRYMSGKG